MEHFKEKSSPSDDRLDLNILAVIAVSSNKVITTFLIAIGKPWCIPISIKTVIEKFLHDHPFSASQQKSNVGDVFPHFKEEKYKVVLILCPFELTAGI